MDTLLISVFNFTFVNILAMIEVLLKGDWRVQYWENTGEYWDIDRKLNTYQEDNPAKNMVLI